ncbi:MAG: hypothetical protein MNPFHGCM_03270 [Gemmatimonadaceae bacterium]|nr:hypothetical protein [Gemmatimonadaceae bacterium]
MWSPLGRTACRSSRRRSIAATLLLIAAVSRPMAAQFLPSQSPERCQPVTRTYARADAWLARAGQRILPLQAESQVLQYHAAHDTPLWEQSDRAYGPFIPNIVQTIRWYDARSGLEGSIPAERGSVPNVRPTQIYDVTRLFLVRDTLVMRAPAMLASQRSGALFNPWSVLREWGAGASAVEVAERCAYRDAWRVVLRRGNERLYLSESDAVPIKLDRIEPHYLWGQVHAEYLWTTWWGVTGGGLYPLASFRVLDGAVYERASVSRASLVLRDSAPDLEVSSARPFPMPPGIASADGGVVDTIRVDENTWILKSSTFSHAVALRRDTVFLFDATTGEARARRDSAMIAQLFPGRHPVVLVVSDVAWPHVSGVRFWIARGATVVSHAQIDRSPAANVRATMDPQSRCARVGAAVCSQTSHPFSWRLAATRRRGDCPLSPWEHVHRNRDRCMAPAGSVLLGWGLRAAERHLALRA